MVLWISIGIAALAICAIVLFFFARTKKKQNYAKVRVMSGKTAAQDEITGNVDILEFDDKNQQTIMLKNQQHGLWVSLTCVKDHSIQYGFFLNDSVIVGREEARGRNHFCILDQKLSRKHCCFIPGDGGEVWLEDMGSTNHTFVNGNRIMYATLLNEGDIVTLGSNEYTFQSERV